MSAIPRQTTLPASSKTHTAVRLPPKSGYGANPKRENARVAAAMWGGADSFAPIAMIYEGWAGVGRTKGGAVIIALASSSKSSSFGKLEKARTASCTLTYSNPFLL